MKLTAAQYIRRIEEVTTMRCPRHVEEQTKGGTKKRVGYPWRYLDRRQTENGFQFVFEVPIGYSVNDIRQEVDALYAACGAYIEIKDRGGVVIIEVNTRDFPDVIPWDETMLTHTTGREVLLGFDRSGKPVRHNFRVPHLLFGGMSGYGKTDILRIIIYQLISRFSPEELFIYIVDGKGFSFLPFRNIPHIRKIVRDLSGAYEIMKHGVDIMNRRSDEVWYTDDRSRTSSYAWHLIIVDELAQISPSMKIGKADKEVAAATYSLMASIACVGREASVGMIMGTQRPDANVVHPQVKQNLDASVAFRCKTVTNSEIILDRPGAEKLPEGKPGRGIYSATEDIHFMAPYVGNDQAWTEILAPYKKEEQEHERIEAVSDLGDLEELPPCID